jgi:hypothetical protein
MRPESLVEGSQASLCHLESCHDRRVLLNRNATCVNTAVVNVTYQGFTSSLTLVNLPKF